MSFERSCIALGFFDGVHSAHRKIIEASVLSASKLSCSPIVLTFDRSPYEVISGKKACYITQPEEKIRLIEELGAKTEKLKLSDNLLSLSPEEFVKNIIIGKYHALGVFCGFNYTFGKGGMGNTALLKELGEKYKFSVSIMPQLTESGVTVSSSAIRSFIQKGDIEKATLLLGHRFSFSGSVNHGKHLGTKIGFPTANVSLPKGMVIPKNGVYKTEIIIDGKSYRAVTNIGTNPTVGTEELRTESFIPSFNDNIYGKTVRLDFISFLREEKKFKTLGELQRQIKKDTEQILR